MHLLLHRPMPFPLLPLGSLGGGGVADIQVRPQYQNITTGAPLVGEVSLLQYDHGPPYITVQEMYSEWFPCCRPPLHPLTGQSCGTAALGKDI